MSDALKPLIKDGANPVVFCRYLATAEHVKNGLRKAFPKLNIASVTGELTPDERRDRVSEMAIEDGEKDVQRILVATDCLSEGINLQKLFNAVIHYDLNWNPTRHQQREGRVDRFGQPAKDVWSVMMFGANSMIDGAVIMIGVLGFAAIEITGYSFNGRFSGGTLGRNCPDRDRGRYCIQADFIRMTTSTGSPGSSDDFGVTQVYLSR